MSAVQLCCHAVSATLPRYQLLHYRYLQRQLVDVLTRTARNLASHVLSIQVFSCSSSTVAFNARNIWHCLNERLSRRRLDSLRLRYIRYHQVAPAFNVILSYVELKCANAIC